LNPGPRTPQARILDQARPRPQQAGLTLSAKGNILKTLFKLKTLGKAESTIEGTADRLKHLAMFCDLDNPEDVKTFIANKRCGNSHKNGYVKAYSHYVQANDLTWEKPKYKWERKIPKIPTTDAVSKIIASASPKYATIFQLLAESGAMPYELHNITLREIDLEREIISIPGFKGHAARVHKLKPKTVAMLKLYLAKYSENQPFPETEWVGKAFRKYRNRLASKLGDPTIKQIRLYDLRHYFGTMTYHKTKDILYTKQQMGHKKIETTLIYTQLVDFGDEEWAHAVAKTLDDACKLIDAGFEYVTDWENVKIFRKRK